MSNLIKNVDLKIKKSILKIKLLRYELLEVEEDLDKYIADFQSAVEDYIKLNKLEGKSLYNSNTKDDDFHGDMELEYSKNIKKAYKKIVGLTHPDKTDSLSESKREKYSDIFLKATESSKSKSVLGIIECAEELGVSLDSLGAEELLCLYQEVDNLKRKIEHHKNTYQWQWGNAGRPEYFVHRYVKNI